MRQLCIAAVLVLGGLGATATQATAGMRCTPYSCIDSRTGYYTQSTCDYGGCRPIPGVVGRVGPGGYDSKYDAYGAYDRPYVRHRWGYRDYRD